MGFLQKKCRTTGKKALAYRGKGGQNTDTAFLALRLGVVLYLLTRHNMNPGHAILGSTLGGRNATIGAAVSHDSRTQW